MKALFRCFAMFLRQITKDSMLLAALAAPFLAGTAFRFGIPALDAVLCNALGRLELLAAYYRLFDLFLIAMTPYIFCFASSMVILTEVDENMAAYLAVTPVGKRGYIISRLLFPAILSIPVTVVLVQFFFLTPWNVPLLLLACLLSSALSVAATLLIVALSSNRVEGMALAKLSGIVLLGLPIPFFISSDMQYLFSPLPSFWIAKLSVEHNGLVYVLPAVLTLFLWIRGLYGRFVRKLA